MSPVVELSYTLRCSSGRGCPISHKLLKERQGEGRRRMCLTCLMRCMLVLFRYGAGPSDVSDYRPSSLSAKLGLRCEGVRRVLRQRRRNNVLMLRHTAKTLFLFTRPALRRRPILQLICGGGGTVHVDASLHARSGGQRRVPGDGRCAVLLLPVRHVLLRLGRRPAPDGPFRLRAHRWRRRRHPRGVQPGAQRRRPEGKPSGRCLPPRCGRPGGPDPHRL